MCASVHIVLSRVREPKSEETKVDLLKAFQNQIQKRLARRAAHVCLVDRLPYYAVAADEPHPDLGRAYSLGKLFAKFCNRPDDPRVVMFGSTIYGNVVSVFPPILQKLFAKFEQRPPDVNQPGR